MVSGCRRLEGKVALVTGGGSRGPGIGNGRAAAVLFAREGARVAVLDRDANAAAETRRMIDAEGGERLGEKALLCFPDLGADLDAGGLESARLRLDHQAAKEEVP